MPGKHRRRRKGPALEPVPSETLDHSLAAGRSRLRSSRRRSGDLRGRDRARAGRRAVASPGLPAWWREAGQHEQSSQWREREDGAGRRWSADDRGLGATGDESIRHPVRRPVSRVTAIVDSRRAHGRCRSRGRTERAHRLLGKLHRPQFPTAPTRVIVFEGVNRRTQTQQRNTNHALRTEFLTLPFEQKHGVRAGTWNRELSMLELRARLAAARRSLRTATSASGERRKAWSDRQPSQAWRERVGRAGGSLHPRRRSTASSHPSVPCRALVLVRHIEHKRRRRTFRTRGTPSRQSRRTGMLALHEKAVYCLCLEEMF